MMDAVTPSFDSNQKKRKMITGGDSSSSSSFQKEEIKGTKPGYQRPVSARSVPFKNMKRIYGEFHYSVRAYVYRSYDNRDATIFPIKEDETHISQQSKIEGMTATLTFSAPENQKIPLVNPENGNVMPLVVCVEGISKVTNKRTVLVRFSIPSMILITEAINANQDQHVEVANWDSDNDFKYVSHFSIERSTAVENTGEEKKVEGSGTEGDPVDDKKEKEEEEEEEEEEEKEIEGRSVEEGRGGEIVSAYLHTLQITFDLFYVWQMLVDPDPKPADNGMTM